MAYVKENNTNSSNSISRDGILSKAKSIINGERQGTYGDAEDSFQTIADMWSAYLKTEILCHLIDVRLKNMACYG